MPTNVTTSVPVYSGNNVSIEVAGQTVALIQTITITRNLGRRPVFQTGTPIFADAPVTQASVTVTVTNMVPKTGSYATLGITPSGSLVSAVDQTPISNMSIVDENGKTVANVINAFFQTDTLSVSSNEPLSISVSFLCQDCQAFI